jgi:tRNA (mo5U34)-methyltransferase
MPDKETAQRLVRAKTWYQEFEIIPGVRTKGWYQPEKLLPVLHLPEDMRGMSFADVGAAEGYFSFEARRRGARVVAFDYRHKDNSGFALIQYVNGITDIEHHQINVLDITAEKFGQFDMVIALGLLYHVAEPYRGLINCAAIARDRLCIESYCIDRFLGPKLAAQPLMRFLPDPRRFPDHQQPTSDHTNFWGFTSTCLKMMLEDVGFRVERIELGDDRVLIDARPLTGDPDDPESWHGF